MNLEEAKENIGAEVEALGELKTDLSRLNVYDNLNIKDVDTYNKTVIIESKCGRAIVGVKKLQDIKLKPQNYKIHVPTEAESREAQELFFELDYEWSGSIKEVKNTRSPYLYAFIKSKSLRHDRAGNENSFNSVEAKQITLQDLREMVAKKKGFDLANDEDKVEVGVVKSRDISLKANGIPFQNFEARKKMTWQDALRAVADGKEVEYSYGGEWWCIKYLCLREIIDSELKFRLAPQRIKLDGEYTKEELLQKIEEME